MVSFSPPTAFHALGRPELRRSRDPEVLKSCDIVVDVGGVYDEAAQRFDHHQRGFTQVFGHGFETKLSSAGLIYKSAVLPPFAWHFFLYIPDISVKTSLQTRRNYLSTVRTLKHYG